MVKLDGHNESRMVYAVAAEFATTCDGVSREDMIMRNEAARAVVWMRE